MSPRLVARASPIRWRLFGAVLPIGLWGLWFAACRLADRGAFDPRATDVSRVRTRAMLSDIRAWDAATGSERRGVSEQVASAIAGVELLRLERFGAGDTIHQLAVLVDVATGVEWMLIPGGCFLMGSPDSEDGRYACEGPQRTVCVAEPFLIARTECTQSVYESMVGSNPSSSLGSEHPVESVSWDDARRFCTSLGWRLPTEAEWEFACRAGTTTPFATGSSLDDGSRVSVVAGASEGLSTYVGRELLRSTGETHARVGQGRASPFGLYDMHGNVWEWCEDAWIESYLGASCDGRAVTSELPVGRVLRGGSWAEEPRSARSASRNYRGRANSFANVGFRPARTVRLRDSGD